MNVYRKCAVIVLMKDGLTFVGERLDSAKAWQFPQGGLDAGENYVQAAVRELFEETGILHAKFIKETEKVYRYKFPKNIQEVILYKYGALSYIGQEQKFCLFDFTGSESEINLKTRSQEFRSWKWMPASEVVDGIIYFKKRVYKLALRELGLI